MQLIITLFLYVKFVTVTDKFGGNMLLKPIINNKSMYEKN